MLETNPPLQIPGGPGQASSLWDHPLGLADTPTTRNDLINAKIDSIEKN